MSDIKPLEAGGTIDLDTVTKLERNVALTMTFAAGLGLWWNWVSVARVIIADVRKADEA